MQHNLNLFQNRELSYLKFNERILMLAKNPTIPLIEKMIFLQIFNKNLDEFFMIRVGSLSDAKILNNKVSDNITNLSSQEQLNLICKKVTSLIKMRDKILHNLNSQLKDLGFIQVHFKDLKEHDIVFVEKIFKKDIRPFISPQIIEKSHPFPFLKNKELYIYIKLYCNKTHTKKTAIIPTNGLFNKIIFLPMDVQSKKIKFLLVEDVFLHFADKIFNKYTIIEKNIFRITRSADLDITEELISDETDMKKAMETLLKKRKRLMPVRLEIYGKKYNSAFNYLSKKLNLPQNQIFISQFNVDLFYISILIKHIDKFLNKDLFFKRFDPIKLKLENKSMIQQIIHKDILISYPFESMSSFITFLDQAAVDENVMSIKITLYRVANNSQIISILKKASENGKDILVVVELRARFDEQHNIDWATSLEESGCKVIYGLENYKVHSKILFITYKNKNEIKYIAQIGTGNYNETTAKSYTDLSLLTANPEITQDILQLFNSICTKSLIKSFKKLLVAPTTFKTKLLDLISEEISFAQKKQKSRIIIKCNSISDKDIILKLIEASQAGVNIDLIVRGICCLLPNIKNYTENIKVRSIIGRFLEHSRIFCFGTDERKKIYISSADLMTRNTTKRIEVACPIIDKDIKEKISSLLSLYLKDNTCASELCSDGSYKKIIPKNNEKIFNSQTVESNYYY